MREMQIPFYKGVSGVNWMGEDDVAVQVFAARRGIAQILTGQILKDAAGKEHVRIAGAAFARVHIQVIRVNTPGICSPGRMTENNGNSITRCLPPAGRGRPCRRRGVQR